MRKGVKLSLVMCGALLVTALGIDAADTLQGSRSTLLGQIIATNESNCDEGMVEIASGSTFRCVDRYEVSPHEDCPIASPENAPDTVKNLQINDCTGISEAGRTPWRYISRDQAQTICLRADKRLPTNEEWHLVALGTPHDEWQQCNISSKELADTGEYSECVSAVGAYDLSGNVWEWTFDDVINGTYQGRNLPQSGYVTSADKGGVAVTSSSTPSEIFDADYMWSGDAGVLGMMRGGFYGSGEDAGVYALHADTAPQTTGAAIGFRCVK